ncbi:hypothetical protein KY290_004936 [Solanum tuberosum]|uniref:Retrovirus-related Pol polyprotein from transposon TNT 1-94-like beta-barrel domain-containing protein n=1 Tax=Solanum tuberosum TaxID=4113 RepID=A0ABQ7WCR2_SOLTU|nr:hypothetical protein KY290_004936 [Solanum tuberosum]
MKIRRSSPKDKIIKNENRRKAHGQGETKRINIKEVNDKTSMQKALTTGRWRSATIVETKDTTPQIAGTRKLKLKKLINKRILSPVTLTKKEDIALATVSEKLVDYEHNWIVDSGCFNHMTSDEKKLINMSEYKGGRVVVTANNSKMSITHIGKTVFVPHHS